MSRLGLITFFPDPEVVLSGGRRLGQRLRENWPSVLTPRK